MSAKEQELLSEGEFFVAPYHQLWEKFTIKDVAEAQVAKLKAMGWKTPEEVKELIQDEHNQHSDDVPWDREKVADYFSRKRYVTLERARGTIGEMSDYNDADQLHKILTGGGQRQKVDKFLTVR